ncbi:MAG: M48 family metalloprotease, partial [Myxococcota bacterium]|nr:M48 family metalloprotease [Myxococcota bacterium]
HYKKRHILLGTILAILQLGLLLWILSFFISEPGLFEAFGVETISTHCGLVFFSLLYSPISFALGIAQSALSRRNEFEADAFAREVMGSGTELSEALKKLSVSNLGNLTPHRLAVVLGYSHPPVLERLAALDAAA